MASIKGWRMRGWASDDGRSSLAFTPRKGSSKGGEHPPFAFKKGRLGD